MCTMEYNYGSDATTFKPKKWLKDEITRNASLFNFASFQVYSNKYKSHIQLF